MSEIIIEEALEAEAARYTAQIEGDIARLDRLFSDDLVYQHSTGLTDDKKGFLQAIESGKVKYRAMSNQNLNIRIVGAVAIITGRARFEVTVHSEESVVYLRFHSIWIKEAGKLKFFSWQATQVAE